MILARCALSKCLFRGATAGKLDAIKVDGESWDVHGCAQSSGLPGGVTSQGGAPALSGSAAEGVLVENAAVASLGVVFTIRHQNGNLFEKRFALAVELAQQ